MLCGLLLVSAGDCKNLIAVALELADIIAIKQGKLYLYTTFYTQGKVIVLHKLHTHICVYKYSALKEHSCPQEGYSIGS